MARPEELFVPFTAPKARVPLATQVRGTVLLASLRAIRARGYGERYRALLDPRFSDDIASLTAAVWLPVNLAIAHYETCDRLALDPRVIDEIGVESGRVINQTVLNVVAKLSKESGVTPWLALSHADKLCARTWVGSSIGVWKLGPKEARLEWVAQPCARVPYFRTAFSSFVAGICSIFAESMYVREIPSRIANEIAYRVQWA